MKKIISIILTLTIVSSAFALNITSANAEEIPTNETFLDIFKDNAATSLISLNSVLITISMVLQEKYTLYDLISLIFSRNEYS